MLVHQALCFFAAESCDLREREVQLPDEHFHDPEFVFNRCVGNGDGTLNGLPCSHAIPELGLRYLELKMQDRVEPTGADGFSAGMRDVRLQNASVVERLLVEDVTASTAAPFPAS